MKEARYCKSCGAYIPKGQRKCVACGTHIGTGGDGGTIQTSRLDENRFSVYPDGPAIYRMEPNTEPILDLDTMGEIKVRFGGKVHSAYVDHQTYLLGVSYGGRALDGRILLNDTLEVRLLLQLK